MSEKIINLLEQISELPEQDENRKELFAELSKEMDLLRIHLSLESNDISLEGAKAIAKVLETNKTLESLYLKSNNISVEGAKAIAKVLETNKALKILDLGPSYIRDEGVKYLADALKKNTTLTKFYIGGNYIRDEGAKYLADALKKNTTLTNFDIRANKIRDEGAEEIAKALEKNTTLIFLGIAYNNISARGAKDLADALKENKTLIFLDLFRNNIGDEGAKHLLEALKENKNITKILLEDNQIGDGLKKQIEDALAKNKEEAERVVRKLGKIFKPNQNQTTKYLSSSLLKDLLPRASAVSEILKKENEETYNSLKQFLSKKLTDSRIGFSKDKKSTIFNNDIKMEIYESLGIDVLGYDVKLKKITSEVLNIAIAIQMQSEINLYSKFLEEKKYPIKNKKPDWQSLDIEVLKPAIEIFLDPKKQSTKKFPDLQSRITFLKEKKIEKHPDYEEGLQKIIEDLQPKQTAKTPLDESEEVKKLKEQLVKSELARKEAEEKVKILEEEFKKLKAEKNKYKDRKGKSKLEESDSEDLSKPSTSVSGGITSVKGKKEKSSCEIM